VRTLLTRRIIFLEFIKGIFCLQGCLPNTVETLCNLVEWSNEWQMLFNADKCKVMHMGFNNKQAKYDMNGVQLERVSEEKDLGVIISEDLKWEKQCSEAVMKANRMWGMIKRDFVDRSKETVISLYKSLVRPNLEYCCQI